MIVSPGSVYYSGFHSTEKKEKKNYTRNIRKRIKVKRTQSHHTNYPADIAKPYTKWNINKLPSLQKNQMASEGVVAVGFHSQSYGKLCNVANFLSCAAL